MTEETTESLLAGYFEKHNLIFYSARPINENGERVMVIEFGCDMGVFLMKLQSDLRLYCQDKTRKKWIEIHY
ncbi:hypothetical protein [Enterococcus sp. BWR-S5]|uniref:hypothetical protein n=1 Tax=Enterococcus sp. BWR-S5 TaxID=2787714 RepID=UPI001923BD87|nr:hypothetical protein [Enterococcus sp. BWR-S5]MBL1226589.1 hypothetical protein [Enterococcus sp. BWR-S5]